MHTPITVSSRLLLSTTSGNVGSSSVTYCSAPQWRPPPCSHGKSFANFTGSSGCARAVEFMWSMVEFVRWACVGGLSYSARRPSGWKWKCNASDKRVLSLLSHAFAQLSRITCRAGRIQYLGALGWTNCGAPRLSYPSCFLLPLLTGVRGYTQQSGLMRHCAYGLLNVCWHAI